MRRHFRNLHKEALLQEGLNADLLDDMHASDILDEAGDVDGPDSATVCNAACFANTDGKSIQDSGVPTGKIVQADAAFTADNRLTKTDRPTSDNRNIQQTGISVDDGDNVSGINDLTALGTVAATIGTFDNAVVTGTIEFPGGYYITTGPSGGIGFFDGSNTLLMEVGTDGLGSTGTDVDIDGKLNVGGDVDPESITLEVVDGIDRPATRRTPVFAKQANGRFLRKPNGRAVIASYREEPVASLFFRTDGKPCIRINGKTLVLAVEAVE